MASKIIVDQLEKTGGTLTALTLPSANATANQMLKNDGAGTLSWGSAAVGLAECDQWYLPTDFTGSVFPITTMARVNFGPYGSPAGTVGTGMGHSAGTFSFPSTGKWLIIFHLLASATTTADSDVNALIKFSINTGGSYTQHAADGTTTAAIGANNNSNATAIYLMDVPNITTHLVQVGCSLEHSGNTVQGSADDTSTNVTFIKVS